ncbi:MAG: RluA family pseudouridine synthase [Proteobacteria bacterium]|nr:RluA family pseudouridine synthase [Pseudomonadota bacterium]
MEKARRLMVEEGRQGTRLDVFLARELELTRRYARRLLVRGGVTLDGRRARAGDLLRAGQRVGLPEFRHPSEGPAADPELVLAALAERDGLLAVDKPAGVPSHPLDCDQTGTALNAVLAIWPRIAGVGSGAERGLVHRLDVHTSGVLVFATEPGAWAAARSAFRRREVAKRYLARVHGRLRGSGEIRLRLANRGARVAVREDEGREAVSRFRALETGAEESLVEIEPLTGVRHQIRASLSQRGHPVVGDRLYGSTTKLDRHLLHAAWIRIGGFEASAPLPAGFGG